MDIQNAIALLKLAHESTRGTAQLHEAYAMSIEALEKQIPKKPINNGVKKCPNCGFAPFDTCETITRNCEVTHIIHCEWCGQAIDYGSDNQ